MHVLVTDRSAATEHVASPSDLSLVITCRHQNAQCSNQGFKMGLHKPTGDITVATSIFDTVYVYNSPAWMLGAFPC